MIQSNPLLKIPGIAAIILFTNARGSEGNVTLNALVDILVNRLVDQVNAPVELDKTNIQKTADFPQNETYSPDEYFRSLIPTREGADAQFMQLEQRVREVEQRLEAREKQITAIEERLAAPQQLAASSYEIPEEEQEQSGPAKTEDISYDTKGNVITSIRVNGIPPSVSHHEFNCWFLFAPGFEFAKLAGIDHSIGIASASGYARFNSVDAAKAAVEFLDGRMLSPHMVTQSGFGRPILRAAIANRQSRYQHHSADSHKDIKRKLGNDHPAGVPNSFLAGSAPQHPNMAALYQQQQPAYNVLPPLSPAALYQQQQQAFASATAQCTLYISGIEAGTSSEDIRKLATESLEGRSCVPEHSTSL
eukprot:gnl/MRDRNA2_/MRDRNA2_77323_c0_seq3.p1 gnl/MRDRNA2_/MRDRNA2_77323_c0~~gnl/MRDRNA2_/MRDRNA2_77323_c0_seq3.p1  ORF type:complete len:362 (+),score=66.62 gnl/MRDRNA2_/MRDRNA2_77323_c0_seq3:135-1220(+)